MNDSICFLFPISLCQKVCVSLELNQMMEPLRLTPLSDHLCKFIQLITCHVKKTTTNKYLLKAARITIQCTFFMGVLVFFSQKKTKTQRPINNSKKGFSFYYHGEDYIFFFRQMDKSKKYKTRYAFAEQEKNLKIIL